MRWLIGRGDEEMSDEGSSGSTNKNLRLVRIDTHMASLYGHRRTLQGKFWHHFGALQPPSHRVLGASQLMYLETGRRGAMGACTMYTNFGGDVLMGFDACTKEDLVAIRADCDLVDRVLPWEVVDEAVASPDGRADHSGIIEQRWNVK